MRNFLPPKPPAVGPRWYALSAAVHVVFLGLLVWVSTHTRDTYHVMRLVTFFEAPDVTRREFTMRVSDPVGVGTKRASSNISGGMGPVSISAVPVGAYGSPGARRPGAFPDSLSIGIPGASPRIPGAIIVGTGRRIGPTFGDGLLWEEADVGIIGEEEVWGAQETLLALEVAEMLADILEDSLLVRGEIPSWVTTIGGQEWGIDSQYIHLGPVKIPTVLAALLAFSNLPQLGNYELAQQQAWLADVRNQILTQAQRMDQMKEFKRAVKALEARKRKERDDERRRRGIVAARDSSVGR